MATTPGISETVPKTLVKKAPKAMSVLSRDLLVLFQQFKDLKAGIASVRQGQAQNRKALDQLAQDLVQIQKDMDWLSASTIELTEFRDFENRAEESSYKAARRRKVTNTLDDLAASLANLSLESSPGVRPIWLPSGMDKDEDNNEYHAAHIPDNYNKLPPGISSSKTTAVSQD
ncbi:hypothetical protein IFR05_012023 [Cadophora sp. M221]|nr:hypothetical protein IFR05_012023 [Cadophora sp. M221]